MEDFIRLDIPAKAADIRKLKVGTFVKVYGTVYTARDQAHKRLAEAIRSGAPLPFDLNGAAIYYCGPTPAPKGKVIGSCGPTTSGRMDAYTPLLIENGLSVMIGKGVRSAEVETSIKAHGALYLTAIGGAAALYSSKVKTCELVAYPDLGCEAVYRLTVEDFPAVVSIV
ncbi:MAG: fumarate hydratase C-terminal domain-containing protein [Clostridiales bacterium]|nr:fumarate hydratase C-terminal domain-containing protein [Clostridiales bacterium]